MDGWGGGKGRVKEGGGRGRVKERGRRVWKKSGNWIEGREERRKGEEGGKGREEKRGVREKDCGGGEEG